MSECREEADDRLPNGGQNWSLAERRVDYGDGRVIKRKRQAGEGRGCTVGLERSEMCERPLGKDKWALAESSTSLSLCLSLVCVQ